MDAEVAFMCSASDEMMEIVQAGSLANSQEPSADLDASALSMAALGGYVALFRHGQVVFCLSRMTAWIGRVDVFIMPGTTMGDCVRAGRAFMEWAQENTRYERLESRSPQKFIYTLGRRCGWRLDALIPHSFADAHGVMRPEYLMGWIRPEGARSCLPPLEQSSELH